jgi:hypothetical protein
MPTDDDLPSYMSPLFFSEVLRSLASIRFCSESVGLGIYLNNESSSCSGSRETFGLVAFGEANYFLFGVFGDLPFL